DLEAGVPKILERQLTYQHFVFHQKDSGHDRCPSLAGMPSVLRLIPAAKVGTNGRSGCWFHIRGRGGRAGREFFLAALRITGRGKRLARPGFLLSCLLSAAAP